MKKYTSCAIKWLAILVIISVAAFIAGIVCILAHSSDVGLQIGLTMLGGVMSILFLTCFFAERSRCLTIPSSSQSPILNCLPPIPKPTASRLLSKVQPLSRSGITLRYPYVGQVGYAE